MTTKLPPPFRGRPSPPQIDYPNLPADPVFVQPDPGAPDDREPMPDAMQQEPYVTETIQVVRTFFWGRPGVLVSGDSPVYYLDEAGRQQIFRPDCYVAFGVDPVAVRKRNGYFIHEVGQPPDVVIEIASVSTARNDLGPKRDLYARLGIGEYWRFDGTGGQFYGEALVGEALVGETLADGEYVRLPLDRGGDGLLSGHSPALGLDFYWQPGRLLFYDPVNRVYLHNLEEAEASRRAEQAARQAAEASRRAEQAARQAAEAEVERLRERLRQLEGRPPEPGGLL